MTLRKLAGSRRVLHYANWEEWLYACDYLNQRYIRRTDICPFADTEMLFASFLACAATVVGGVAFSELSVSKHHEEDQKGRYGRSDLYVDFPKVSYSFEIKRSKKMANMENLSDRLNSAVDDIKRMPADEHDYSAAILYGHASISGKEFLFEKFAVSGCVDYAFKFEADCTPASYLFMKLGSEA